MDAQDRTAITYRYERWRAVTNGVLEAGATTFLLLIAVKWFEAGATAKALVACGGSAGLLLTPLTVSFVQNRGWPTAQAAARLSALGALTFVVMAVFPSLAVFVPGSVVAIACSSAAIPLLTQMYQENYPEKRRGHFFSRAVMIRIGVAALFSEFAGRALSDRIDQFQFLLLVFALAFAGSALALTRCPSHPLASAKGSHPFRSLRYARQDKLFRHVLICWMLMGFANLMMLPLRVEFLANPDYGMALDVAQVAFLVGVVPNVARLVLNPFWGWVFDRANFFTLRIVLNVGFALGIFIFFNGSSPVAWVTGALIHGASNAGGDVAWGLWVTKFAPANRVADYMSVHTFFTGIRGVMAPLTAFHLIGLLPVQVLALVSCGMIVLASLLLAPAVPLGRNLRPGAALVEEVSD